MRRHSLGFVGLALAVFCVPVAGACALGEPGKAPGAGDLDDVAFLGRAIDWLAAQGCVDRHRVYATGLSGGGRMSSWLGCVAAHRFRNAFSTAA